jgi:hypothetical protein
MKWYLDSEKSRARVIAQIKSNKNNITTKATDGHNNFDMNRLREMCFKLRISCLTNRGEWEERRKEFIVV